MTIRKIEINGREYQFVNESRNTRSGFAHDATLFRDGNEIAKASCHYLNRTWECYRYQTVMQRCIGDFIEICLENTIRWYKREHDIKRLTAEKREKITEEFYQQKSIKELQEVKKQLDYNN